MPASSTLEELHRAVQCLFAWDNSHLHRFYRTPPRLRGSWWKEERPHLTHEQIQDAIMKQYEEEEWVDLRGRRPSEHRHDETTTVIGLVLTAATPRLSYQYDFGDTWDHIVQLERTLAAGSERRAHYPICIGGRKRAPPPVEPTSELWELDKINIPAINAKLKRIPDIDWRIGAGGAFEPADQPDESDLGEEDVYDDDELEEEDEEEEEEEKDDEE